MKKNIKDLLPYLAFFECVQLLTRSLLSWGAAQDINFTLQEWGQIILKGIWFDAVVLGFCAIPVCVAMLVPALKPLRLVGRFLFVFVTLFTAVSEYYFWLEFNARFNFIAVDYLVYTHEVLQNIQESYPVGTILAGIMLVTLILVWFSVRYFLLLPYPAWRVRLLTFMASMVYCCCAYLGSNMDQASIADDTVATELAANGYYNLFYAFWNNEIDFERFYATYSPQKVREVLHTLLSEENSQYVSHDIRDIRRYIHASKPEIHPNIMLVVMESMSAEYMGYFGNQQHLTPVLDRLAQQGFFFSQTYATGTRTVRGLEAIALSIPPTPGQSILRRPKNSGLFSLGYVLKEKGYATRFLYGGYGYFDNMNRFFSGNDFAVTDRTDIKNSDIHFSNVWGVCDEDLFAQSLRMADESYKQKKPFLHLMMTTSNHRPYTYPEGRIDIPSHSGRAGGVKYADYSIGKFLDQAKRKPWFNQTIFVFVADHTAGAGGKMDFDAERYHIPMIFYAPALIKPRQFTAIASQIDLAPILLGFMNMSYLSKFYGEDLLHDPDEVPHAFISTYQKVGMLKHDMLTVLEPHRTVHQYHWPEIRTINQKDKTLIDETISFYQSASWWRQIYRKDQESKQ
jgi:phosphoglycerol transferase MdoB-like AlkP superfamily enzyme